MKTWRKALRRLAKQATDRQAVQFPHVYRRLTPVELRDLVRQAWTEVSSKLTSVPRQLLVSSRDVPASRPAVWSMALMRAVVQ